MFSPDSPEAEKWTAIAHSLMNVKEFVWIP
jgi:hypothetical protein